VEELRSIERTNKSSRREVVKTGLSFMIAALWGTGPAFAQEMTMTDTKKSHTLDFELHVAKGLLIALTRRSAKGGSICAGARGYCRRKVVQ
jgi:hypothetical protein